MKFLLYSGITFMNAHTFRLQTRFEFLVNRKQLPIFLISAKAIKSKASAKRGWKRGKNSTPLGGNVQNLALGLKFRVRAQI